jgi:hypothetical protein
MGEQLEGKILNKRELAENTELIKSKYHDYVEKHFSEINPNRDYELQTIGDEIEMQFVDANGNPMPVFDELQRMIGEDNLSPEVVRYHGEVKHTNLFKLSSSLDEVVQGIHNIFNPVYAAAKSLGVNIALMGGLPHFNAKMGEAMVSDNLRTKKLRKFITPHAKPVRLHFADGSRELITEESIQGYTSLQTNTKVPHYIAGFYHDAGNLLGPLFAAVFAGSPLYDGRLTNRDSVRSVILPAKNHGFEDKNRPGRWRALDPLTENSFPENFDYELYEKIRSKHPDFEHVAKYFATVAADGHLLISENDLYGNGDFPKPTSWPWMQMQTGKYGPNNSVLDDYGIVIEGRYIDTPSTVEDMAACSLFWPAALEGVAKKMREGKIKPLSADKVKKNVGLANSYTPNQVKQVYWPITNGSPFKKLSAAFEYVGKLAVKTLREYGHSEQDIENIVNPILTRAGVAYQNNRFKELGYSLPNPARIQRYMAMNEQPNIEFGEKLNPSTIGKIVEAFHYKGLPQLSTNQEMRLYP